MYPKGTHLIWVQSAGILCGPNPIGASWGHPNQYSDRVHPSQLPGVNMFQALSGDVTPGNRQPPVSLKLEGGLSLFRGDPLLWLTPPPTGMGFVHRALTQPFVGFLWARSSRGSATTPACHVHEAHRKGSHGKPGVSFLNLARRGGIMSNLPRMVLLHSRKPPPTRPCWGGHVAPLTQLGSEVPHGPFRLFILPALNLQGSLEENCPPGSSRFHVGRVQFGKSRRCNPMWVSKWPKPTWASCAIYVRHGPPVAALPQPRGGPNAQSRFKDLAPQRETASKSTWEPGSLDFSFSGNAGGQQQPRFKANLVLGWSLQSTLGVWGGARDFGCGPLLAHTGPPRAFVLSNPESFETFEVCFCCCFA